MTRLMSPSSRSRKHQPGALLGRLAMVGLLFLAGAGAAWAQALAEKPRGELLYNTHCIACHTTQVHWRDQRLVTDWASLQKQVWRWQSNINLNWDENDVLAVSAYLNTLFYRFDPPELTSQAGGARSR